MFDFLSCSEVGSNWCLLACKHKEKYTIGYVTNCRNWIGNIRYQAPGSNGLPADDFKRTCLINAIRQFFNVLVTKLKLVMITTSFKIETEHDNIFFEVILLMLDLKSDYFKDNPSANLFPLAFS
jgi:hypothetical protein